MQKEYLTYNEYINMGGTLEQSAFFAHKTDAEMLINSQMGGNAGIKLAELSEVPQGIKYCVFKLINYLYVNSSNGKQISSESQSQGGDSESYSYVVKADEQIALECDEIIEKCLNGSGLQYLLYRGAL